MNQYGRRLVGLATVFLLAVPMAEACLNDRDSDEMVRQVENQRKSEEASRPAANDSNSGETTLRARMPETIQVITGRFPRNPPLFYEMRISRAQSELSKDPEKWGLYDDIAVAMDRLGRTPEALAEMNLKRMKLPPYDATNKDLKEAWYRYYANNGTFLAHNWIHEGAKKEDISQLWQAIDEIKQAIKIKPDAHFGRERYQLFALEWLQDLKSGKKNVALSDQIKVKDKWEDSQREGKLPHRQKAAEGISGLVVLGTAWESPDMFEALARSLDSERSNGLSYMALLRCDELIKAGKKPKAGKAVEYLSGIRKIGFPFDDFGYGWQLGMRKRVIMEDLYTDLRGEADQWLQNRNGFMTSRLKDGRHPDWDNAFWDGYQETEPPSMDVSWRQLPDKSLRGKWQKLPASQRSGIILLAGGSIVGIFLAGTEIWKRRRRR